MDDGVDKFQVEQPPAAALSPVDHSPLTVPPARQVYRRALPELSTRKHHQANERVMEI